MKAGLTLAAVFLFAAACADEPRKPAGPTAPTVPSAAVAATEPAPAMSRAATVCLSYGRDREIVRSELKDKPGNEALEKKLKALDDLILDAC